MSRLPDPLRPYVTLPLQSSHHNHLFLVTSVLSASATWLSHAFLSEALLVADRSVVFVSFLQTLGFHRDAVRRLGVDLPLYTRKSKFAFIDGLSTLFDPSPPPPLSSGAIELRIAGKRSGIEEVKETISRVVRGMGTGGEKEKPMLIVEGLDFLLASLEGVGVGAVTELVLELQELVSSTILTLNADSAFMSQQHPRTRLEIEHAAFVTTMAHAADWVVGLRQLETGVARDVSGVLRITRGAEAAERKGGEGSGAVEEKEMLYFVGEGGVRVFARGEMR